MRQNTQKWHVPVLAVLCCIFWGLAFPGIRFLYAGFHADGGQIPVQILLAGVRFTGAGTILLLMQAVRGIAIWEPFHGRPEMLAQTAGFGFLQTGVQYACFYASMNWLPSGRASLINTTNAFLSVVLAHFFCRGDRMNHNKVLGCVLGLGGIALLCGDIRASGTLPGDILMLLSALSFSVGNIVCQRLTRHFNSISLAGWQMLFGGLALMILGWLTEGNLQNGTWMGWFVMGLFILQSAICFAIWSFLLTQGHVSSIGIYTCIIPVVGVIVSAGLPGEAPSSGITVVSLMLTVLGVAVVNAAKPES